MERLNTLETQFSMHAQHPTPNGIYIRLQLLVKQSALKLASLQAAAVPRLALLLLPLL